MDKEDVDVLGALAYEVEQDSRDEESKSMLTEDRYASFDSRATISPRSSARPWAGGTHPLHRTTYYDLMGGGSSKIRFWREPAPDLHPRRAASFRTLSLPGVVGDSLFDLGKMLAERHQLSAHLAEPSRVPASQRNGPTDNGPRADPKWRRSPGWRTEHGRGETRTAALRSQVLASRPEPIALGELVGPLDEPLAARLLLYFKRARRPRPGRATPAGGAHPHGRRRWSQRAESVTEHCPRRSATCTRAGSLCNKTAV